LDSNLVKYVATSLVMIALPEKGYKSCHWGGTLSKGTYAN